MVGRGFTAPSTSPKSPFPLLAFGLEFQPIGFQDYTYAFQRPAGWPPGLGGLKLCPILTVCVKIVGRRPIAMQGKAAVTIHITVFYVY